MRFDRKKFNRPCASLPKWLNYVFHWVARYTWLHQWRWSLEQSKKLSK